ncbi:hypothetical protein LVISKB_1165 [Levilactobacillus brevis KB290]|uniref:Uncharacterized protein n=1 Tax=Levilactobacillus brevis KB290 TaxID=1001583 RepID=M5AEF6_LEVBR|nr:hypothetical protein LVISKB_1165 [Levilactobacillus brevis KB290]
MTVLRHIIRYEIGVAKRKIAKTLLLVGLIY